MGFQLRRDAAETLLHDAHAIGAVLDHPNFRAPGPTKWSEIVDQIDKLRRLDRKRFDTREEIEAALWSHGPQMGISVFVQDLVRPLIEKTAESVPSNPRLPSVFPPGIAEKLGAYVYALRDPRDRQVFYVGKGRGERIFSHVWGAASLQPPASDDAKDVDGKAVRQAKYARIREIWSAGLAVEHFVVRPRITPAENDDLAAYQLEQVMIDVLRLNSSAGPSRLTNIVGGHKSDFAVELIEEFVAREAAMPAPAIDRPFLILNARDPAIVTWTRSETYEHLRGWWRAKNIVDVQNLPIFVVHKDIIRAAFRTSSWEQLPDRPIMWAFNRSDDDEDLRRFEGSSVRHIREARNRQLWQQEGWNPYYA